MSRENRKSAPKAFPESVRGVALSDTHTKQLVGVHPLNPQLARKNVRCPTLAGDTGGGIYKKNNSITTKTVGLKQKIPEGLHIYRQKILIEKFEPEWGRTIFSHYSFYKYVIPMELFR